MVVIVQIQTGRKVKISGHYNNQNAATSRPPALTANWRGLLTSMRVITADWVVRLAYAPAAAYGRLFGLKARTVLQTLELKVATGRCGSGCGFKGQLAAMNHRSSIFYSAAAQAFCVRIRKFTSRHGDFNEFIHIASPRNK